MKALAVVGTAAVLAFGAASARAGTAAVAWGDNSGGELGNGTFTQSDAPVGVSGLSTVRSAAAGYRFSLALLKNGTVVAWGENQFGQLGDGKHTDSTVPVAVSGAGGVTQVAAGGGHALALLANGTVIAWGDNAFGQLGDGTTTSRAKPVVVKGLTGVKAIAAGELDSLALLKNGTVVAWGDNRDGELGNGTTSNSSVPVPVKGLTGVARIAAGGLFDVVLRSDGTARAWGEGDAGELGNGGSTFSDVPVSVSGLSGAVGITAGGEHALALLKGGKAVGWGDNTFGQLGNPGAGQSVSTPVPVAGLSGIRALAAGGNSSLALLASGAVDSWGDNALGQLGNGTTNDRSTPAAVPGLTGISAIAAGANHALAVKAGSSPAVTPHPSAWATVSTPNPGAPPPPGVSDVAFSNTSAASPDDAWAVGTNGSFGSSPFGIAAHWDGTAWRTVPMARPPGPNFSISGVLDLSSRSAWAVGSQTIATGQTRTLIEHWNGTSWSVVPSPNPIVGVGGQDQFNAIAGVSARDIWAVGEFFDSSVPGSNITLLFAHFNGTKWVAAPSPPSTGFDFAESVVTISRNDAWAVGSNALQTTLAAHWDGKKWTIVPTPSPQDGNSPTNDLTGVTAVASNNVWASGFEANVNGLNFDKPYLLHWDGHTWRIVLAPNIGTEGSLFRGIVALSARDIWAVGHTQENDGSILTLAEHFNGTSWSPVPTPDPGAVGTIVSNGLNSVASAGGGLVWALGSQETLGLCCTRTLALRNKAG